MMKLLDKLFWAQGPMIFSCILGVGFGSSGKYPRFGWGVVAGAFVFVFLRELIHKASLPKEVKKLTLEDVNGPDSLEEYMAQRRKVEHQD
jgi:hypothetical protein